MKSLTAFLIALALTAAADDTEQRALQPDAVKSYAAPEITTFNPEGKAVLDVIVRPDGSVSGVAVISDKAHVADSARFAARKWKFEPQRRNGVRTKRVTFVFERARETDCAQRPTVRYESPLTVIVQPLVATVSCLPHEARTCEVHGTPMAIERLPIVYGMPAPPPPGDLKLREEFFAALQRDFPHAQHIVTGGDVMRPEHQMEVYICPKCREAEKRWLDAHPGFVRP